MLKQIKLTNFKCFQEETTFPLSNFNLLTGINSSGKSTFLQALLLMRQSIEYDIYTTRLVLNGSCVNLGSFDDVRNRNISRSESIFFEFEFHNTDEQDTTKIVFEGKVRYQLEPKIDEMSLHIPGVAISQRSYSENPRFPQEEKRFCLYHVKEDLYSDVDSTGSKPHIRFFRLIKLNPNFFFKVEEVERKRVESEQIPLLSAYKKYVSPISLMQDDTPRFTYCVTGFSNKTDLFDYFQFVGREDQDDLYLEKIHFISADRIGPQEFYWKKTLPKFANVGIKGEWAVNLLDKIRDKLVNEALCLGEDAKTLITQTEAWLGKILSPLKLEVPPSKTNILEFFLGESKPTNVGFGYSSALPIVVSGLVAQPGEKLIVENPEIHLHPKAQSALIAFLVKVANTGVQVFVESHSDHVLNALRIAVLKKQLTSDEVNILYFQENISPIKIDIEEDGRIENWPTDFFDQMGNDFSVLFGI